MGFRIIIAVFFMMSMMSTKVNKDSDDVPETIYIHQHEQVEDIVEEEEVAVLTDGEIDLISLITIAEAEGESEYGKRLVIDTILNRLDSSNFPNSVHGVIYQPSQFSCVWNGRIKRCVVTEEVRKLVRDELKHRSDLEVIFFNAGRYSNYGSPMFKEGHHYFCSWE